MLAFLPLVRTARKTDDGPMFSVYCNHHGSEVLLPTSHITGLWNTLEGIVMGWRCYCGETGSLVTGRPRVPRSAPAIQGVA